LLALGFPLRKIIVWFRQDLRVLDNPALFHAAQAGHVIPLYIWDKESDNPWPLGGASRWWLASSLQSMRASGVPLVIRCGHFQDILEALIHETGAEDIYWNRVYEPWAVARDTRLEAELSCQVKTFNASLLFDPHAITNKQGGYFRVFTPFWKSCLNLPDPRSPLPKPQVQYVKILPQSLDVEDLGLISKANPWWKKFDLLWQPGEEGAVHALNTFLKEALSTYKPDRDFPRRKGTSRLSPHLHFGEISPQMIWCGVKSICPQPTPSREHFLSELGWREFSHYLLMHFPDLPTHAFQEKFQRIPWRQDHQLFEAWKRGKTGFPFIDAGMRELWNTGYMHNRLRMVTASFLVKHGLVSWVWGESWFWDTLLDADLANNAAGWQWVAGTGADAAPYFRIFNPITQSERFEAGSYIRHHVPELANFPDRFIHAPWRAPADIQEQADCMVGRDYPEPILDLDLGRKRALAAYKMGP
jgi:deoxyribodipyrimidine photo-lyase